MALTSQQKQLRETLAAILHRQNPGRSRKWAVKESRRKIREALADAPVTVKTPAGEDLTKLDSHELAAQITRAWASPRR